MKIGCPILASRSLRFFVHLTQLFRNSSRLRHCAIELRYSSVSDTGHFSAHACASGIGRLSGSPRMHPHYVASG